MAGAARRFEYRVREPSIERHYYANGDLLEYVDGYTRPSRWHYDYDPPRQYYVDRSSDYHYLHHGPRYFDGDYYRSRPWRWDYDSVYRPTRYVYRPREYITGSPKVVHRTTRESSPMSVYRETREYSPPSVYRETREYSPTTAYRETREYSPTLGYRRVHDYVPRFVYDDAHRQVPTPRTRERYWVDHHPRFVYDDRGRQVERVVVEESHPRPAPAVRFDTRSSSAPAGGRRVPAQWASTSAQRGRKDIDDLFNEINTSGDGKITREQLRKWCESSYAHDISTIAPSSNNSLVHGASTMFEGSPSPARRHSGGGGHGLDAEERDATAPAAARASSAPEHRSHEVGGEVRGAPHPGAAGASSSSAHAGLDLGGEAACAAARSEDEEEGDQEDHGDEF